MSFLCLNTLMMMHNNSSTCNHMMDTLLQLLYTGLVTDTP